jgi:transcriptional regulator with XRE-family HTH domain
MTSSTVTLRIQELAEEKVYHLLSLTSGVSEEVIQLYAIETATNFKKIATVLGKPIAEADINQVFEMLTPEIAQEKSLSLLSEASNISEENINRYANETVELTQETITHFKKIAEVLDVSVVKLIKPSVKKEAVKLKISQLLDQKQISLENLSEKTGLDIAILCFYSTQAIDKQKLEETKFQINLSKISKILECSIDDLKDTNIVELPPSRVLIKEFADERNLSLEDLSLVTGINLEFLSLISDNPVDMKNLPNWGTEQIICKLICSILGCSCQ